MGYEVLLTSLNEMASDFMFLEGPEIDIPSTGKLLNHLEKIVQEAEEGKMAFIPEVATGMSQILEKLIFDAFDDKTASFPVMEKGIALLQSIADGYLNSGRYDGNIQNFREAIASLMGQSPVAADSRAADQAITHPAGEGEGEGAEIALAGEFPEAEKNSSPAATFEVQDESLVRDFIAEGLEYIEEIEINILNLEKNPEDKEYINAIFRPFHSIKGVASFLNLEKIRSLAHNLENLLDKARNGELEVTPVLIDLVLDGADTLKTLIGQLRDQLEGKGPEVEDLELEPLLDRIAAVEKGLEDSAKNKKIGEILLEDGHITKDALEEGLKIAQATPGKKLGEALISEGRVTPKQVSQALRKQVEQVTDNTSVRVDTGKLDDLIDMVGELVITQSMVQQDIKNQLNADRNLIRDISQFFRITSGLQKISTSLRMVPIKQTFQRMSRLIRDLAKNADKTIAVEMEGEDTEIDRNMVEEIYNPLVHMIRNSVDHGIEKAEERIRAGKRPQGLICLKAYHRGGSIVIEIADDGKGLDKEKILNKALRNGLIQNAEGLSEAEVYRMIFLPGLSTAEKVTDVSGRGVGMDVVKRAVEKLRGKIEIESVYGQGTTFLASFPLTMAIIDGMIVKVGPEYYILPTTAIRQALRPEKKDYNNVVGRGETVNVMGQLLPLVRLYSLFGIKAGCQNPWEAIVVVVEGENRSKCLLVDEIIGKTEVVIKSLGKGFGKIKGVSGGAILGDGRIGLILDTEGIFELSENASCI